MIKITVETLKMIMKMIWVTKCQSSKVKKSFINCRHLVIETILELGNQVLANIGVEEPIDDVAVFFSD